MATVRWVCISKRWHQFKCGWKGIQTKVTVFVWIIWSWKCHWRWKNIAIIRKIPSATHVRAQKCGKTNAVAVSWDCKRRRLWNTITLVMQNQAFLIFDLCFYLCFFAVFRRPNEFKVMDIQLLHTKWWLQMATLCKCIVSEMIQHQMRTPQECPYFWCMVYLKRPAHGLHLVRNTLLVIETFKSYANTLQITILSILFTYA